MGIDVPERAEQVVRAAAAEAKGWGAVLSVLHIWSLPSACDDIIFSRTDSRAVLREADSPVLLVGPRPSRGWKDSPRGATEGVVQPA